ncbi:hypothetical protein KVR01_008911 [Diaporthe batatas]|uniref:uncharacterized protein n=1 Tax=Diaporthe batatas TaxID=748121 RepID=UPI001D042E03|nr:uncharacterized protein KVR01_008911 [Diaporthe batatas]KAG8160647.1 hypothetical protein KVR01_008911 [Diaporthe batatas]
MDNNEAADVGKSLLDLPGELRNTIYTMVIHDSPRSIPWTAKSLDGVLGLHVCQQSALARVNRQLRCEFLSMWYGENSVGAHVYPKKHEGADQAWQDFVDRLDALRAPSLWSPGPDGTTAGRRSCLSHIRSLEVQLWHPAYDFAPEAYMCSFMLGTHEFSCEGVYPLELCNGVYLLFGPTSRDVTRAGGDATDWTDRGAVWDVLADAIG